MIGHQSMSKGYSHKKQVLSIDNNWRNTEICHRSGSVSHADTRGSLRCVSWDKKFTPYALNLNIQFISTGLYKAEQTSKDTIYFSGLIPMGTLGVRVRSCLPLALPGFPGRLTRPFQGLLLGGHSLGNHTEWSPTGFVLLDPDKTLFHVYLNKNVIQFVVQVPKEHIKTILYVIHYDSYWGGSEIVNTVYVILFPKRLIYSYPFLNIQVSYKNDTHISSKN